MTSSKWLVAATVLLAAGLAWLNLGDRSLGPTAFADEIPGIDQVQQLTWTVTFYTRVSSKDGKRAWVEKERRLFAYRHPGQYRETRMTPDGEVVAVVISDHNAGRTLEMYVKDKKAMLKSLDHRADPRGPFAWEGDALRSRELASPIRVKSVSLPGKAQLDDAEVDVARVMLQDTEQGRLTRLDMYFDPATKRLAGMWSPNESKDERADLEKEAKNPGKDGWRYEPVASLTSEIRLQPDLKAADFSLEAPADFATETIAPPTVTEDEMLEYLQASAAYNDGVFPDSPFIAYDADKLNVEWEKEESARTAAANTLIAQIDKFRRREIYEPPLKRFLDDNTEPDSFQFVGSGVKLGKADQIILWYRLRHGGQLRAIYGDMSVRDVSEKDLPFAVSK